MPVRLSETTVSGARPRHAKTAATTPLSIALVNNMPDSALLATERQFSSLVRTAAGRRPVRIRVFSSKLIARGPDAAHHVATHHGSFADLLASRFDAAIVTGNEPRAPRLDQEPYWDDMRRLTDWAEMNTRTVLWSCLAAHAAVLHLDGIERVPLPRKLSGVFDCVRTGDDSPFSGLQTRVWTPHSRLNTIRERDLTACGYRILSRSDAAGVDTFARDGRSLFLFAQGHPEYDTDTLLREFRRDVGRFLRGDTETYPDMPANYFSSEATAILSAFRRRALAHRNPALFEIFPNVAVPFAITNRWNEWTVQFYRAWLDLAARQAASA